MTVAQDTVHGGVNYDTNDRYCLDGQRLILTSGTYGADGSVYRTEIDHFSKIVAHGTAGNGPSWFEVHTPAGLDLQYGNTTDSQILAVGKTTARVWAVNKVTDPKGNYYTVSYTNDTTNGQYYPARIDYTGNASASLSTYNSVQFSYTTRSDIVPYYQAGSLIQTTVLLTDIKTYTGTTLIRDYKLTYTAASSAASHDELNEVQICDVSSNCLAPTTFGWQGSRDNPSLTTTANSLAHGLTLAWGDFNGDGLTDAAVNMAPTCISSIQPIWYGTTTGGFVDSASTTTFHYYSKGSMGNTVVHTVSGTALWNYCWDITGTAIGDLAGNGLQDVLVTTPYYRYVGTYPNGNWITGSTAEILLNNGSGAYNLANPDNSIPHWPYIVTPPALGGDFDGDGRIDGYVRGTGTFTADFSNGDGTFTAGTAHSTPTTVTSLVTGDFDGDGCTDIWMQSGSPSPGYQIDYFCQPAVPTWSTSTLWPPSSQFVGDFNGDGKTDFLVVTSSGATLYLSTGTGFATGIAIPSSSSWFGANVTVGDWNGDGKDDIAVISQTSGTPHKFFLSTGTGFIQLSTTLTNTDTTNQPTVADWNNDGAKDIWLQRPSGDTEILFAYSPELMTSVSNGVGATTTVTYDRINRAAIYTKGTGATYPTKDVDGPIYAVSQLSTSNGIGGTMSWTYAYSGLKQDQHGRGSLGYSQVKATDSQTGIVTTSNYQTAFPYTGLLSSQTVVSGTTTLRSITNTYNSTNEGTSSPGAAYYLVTLYQSAVSGADLDGTTLPSTTTTYTYDAYGNVLTKTASVSDGSSSTTTNTYNNDTTDWFIGQLLTSQTQNIVGSSNLTRHYSVSWSATSKPSTVVLEPGNSALSVTDTIGYDGFDNADSQSYSGSGITTRGNGVTFDTKGQFATTVTNALSQSSSVAYNSAFGEVTSVTDPNSLTSTASYDTLGRATGTVRPDGNQVVTTYAYCSGVNGGTATCPTYGAYLAQSEPEDSSNTQNGPITITYYDALGRVIATQTEGFDGSWIQVSTSYDSKGRVYQTSRPYFVSGGTAKWTTYTYDALARVTLATFPDTSTTSYAYHGLTSSTTNANSQTTTTVLNAQGLVASRTDANSKTTSYVYDAFGDLTQTTDPSGNVIANTFDLRGRKTASSDPDMGSWSYAYDVLSELTSQTDAKSQTTTLSYDLLGRPTQRAETGLTSNWVYDTATDGIGALASACTGTSCTSPSTSSYFRAHAYDTYGRPSSVAMSIAGGANNTYTLTYDANGRIATETYPSGFVAKYVYTSLGYLSEIVDNSTSTVYWQANSRDAELHLLQATAGNGVVTNQSFDPNTGLLSSITAGPSSAVANFSYSWDPIGNLTSRTDTVESYTEKLCYDSLNRLTNYAIGSSCTSGSPAKTVAYDQLGNITSKSDIGTYNYPTAGSALPHAVSSITGTVNGVTNPTFTYDANGNMTAGAGRTIAYTGFNMAASITEGSATTSLTYDSEHKRIVQSAPSATTTYLNDPMTGSMSEEVVSGATTTWHDYMAADGGIVAERFNTGGTVTVAYFNTDHLGSTAVLTDGSGTVAERDSFDAWGMRRNPNGTDAACGTITSATTRGYTGQEMMDALCAINMNARIYDPGMGRFMSADPTIPDPMNGQSFNRYSYVNNGPMSATDPSGLDGNTVEEEEKQKPIDTSLTDPFYAFNPPTGSRLYGGFTGDSSAAALLSAGEGGNFLADAVGGGNIQLYASAFGRSSTSGYWTPTVGGSYWGGIENSIETVVVWSTRSYWIPSSLTSIGGFQQNSDMNRDEDLFPFENKTQYELGNRFILPVVKYLASHWGVETHGGAGWGYSASLDNHSYFAGAGLAGGEFTGIDLTADQPLLSTIHGNPYGVALQVNVSASLTELGFLKASGLNIPAGLSGTFYFSFSNFGSYEGSVDVTGPSVGASGSFTLGYRGRY